MIPFDEIDQRLLELGKNRKWLVEVTGRSDHAIRAALAPNAAKKSRSTLLQKALTDAIEREKFRQSNEKSEFKKILQLEPKEKEYRLWSRAWKKSKHDRLEEWMVAALNEASGALRIVDEPKVAEDPADYGSKTS
ncbi:MAG: hypothetical protein RLZ22_254 [Verrucomicrobiota bacterium]|jgi:hypothetical protein